MTWLYFWIVAMTRHVAISSGSETAPPKVPSTSEMHIHVCVHAHYYIVSEGATSIRMWQGEVLYWAAQVCSCNYGNRSLDDRQSYVLSALAKVGSFIGMAWRVNLIVHKDSLGWVVLSWRRVPFKHYPFEVHVYIHTCSFIGALFLACTLAL